MKNIFYILLLLPTIIFAQYPSNSGQKITLGEQTTADGLVWRGVANDTNVITPFSDTSAYIILDTVNSKFYHYNRTTTYWSLAGGGVSVSSFSAGTTGLTPSTATTGAVTLAGTLAVANGGTNLTTFTSANRVPYSSSATQLTTSENLTFDNNTLLLRKNSTGNQFSTFPNIAVENSSTSIRSYSAIKVSANNNTVVGDILVDGIGELSGTPLVAFRTVTAHPFAIFTKNTERIRIDTFGNIGLNVIPSSWGSQFKAIESGDINNQSSIAFNTTANGLNFFANAFFDGSNTKYKYNGFATRFVTADGKYEYYSAPSGTAGNNISWTEVMTIDASGNLGINQPAPTQKLHVVGNARITAMNGIGDIGADANGVLQAATSDMNLKNTIENTPFGLNEILLLNPVTFLYNDENRKIDSDVKEVGFIAQDVFDIIPNAVSSTGTGDLQLDYRAITATLVKAIQEQNLFIKALEQRILILENK